MPFGPNTKEKEERMFVRVGANVPKIPGCKLQVLEQGENPTKKIARGQGHGEGVVAK